MALSKITAASITDNTITNTQINSSAAIAKTKLAALDIVNADVNASAAIASTKLGTMAVANMPAGSILQVGHVISNSSTTYATTSSSGHDILDKTITTKKANSTFYVHWSFYHGVADTVNNMDTYDMHIFALRTANSTHAYVGGNTSLTRQVAGSPADQRIYGTDVPFAPSRGLTPDYGNSFDGYNRSGHFLDSPGLAAGVTNRYRLRLYTQATVYLNRARGSASQSGGVSSLVIMEVAV